MQLLEDLSEAYSNSNNKIRVIFAIDQINIYYSLFRRLLFNQDEELKKQLQHKALTLSGTIELIKRSFKIIFNSSPNFERGV